MLILGDFLFLLDESLFVVVSFPSDLFNLTFYAINFFLVLGLLVLKLV